MSLTLPTEITMAIYSQVTQPVFKAPGHRSPRLRPWAQLPSLPLKTWSTGRMPTLSIMLTRDNSVPCTQWRPWGCCLQPSSSPAAHSFLPDPVSSEISFMLLAVPQNGRRQSAKGLGHKSKADDLPLGAHPCKSYRFPERRRAWMLNVLLVCSPGEAWLLGSLGH